MAPSLYSIAIKVDYQQGSYRVNICIITGKNTSQLHFGMLVHEGYADKCPYDFHRNADAHVTTAT